jgi:hypothetical protein
MEYYCRLISSETEPRPYGEDLQTREHILHSCALYETHRDILHDAPASIYLPDILGAMDGIATLAHFFEESGAFTKNDKSPQAGNHPQPWTLSHPTSLGRSWRHTKSDHTVTSIPSTTTIYCYVPLLCPTLF